MSWVATAIVGSSVIGGGLSYLGAQSAGSAQANAANNALNYQKQIDARNQENMAPFLASGKQATGLLDQSYSNPASFTNTPDYQFGLSQGTSALQNSAAARGGLLGGNFARGITQFGQDYGTNYLQRYRAGLQGTASMGATAATGNGYLGNQSAGMVGNSMLGVGQAQASGTVGGINALTGSASSGINNYLLYNALNRSSYGGGGGGSPTSLSPFAPGNIGGSGGNLGGFY